MEKDARELGPWKLKLRYEGGMEKLRGRAEKNSREIREQIKPVIRRAKSALDSEARKERPNACRASKRARKAHLGEGFLGGGALTPFEAKAYELVGEGKAEAEREILKEAVEVEGKLGRRKMRKVLPPTIASVVCTVAGAIDAFATWLGKLLPGTGHDHLIRVYNELGGDDFWNPDPGGKGYGLAVVFGVLALVCAWIRRVELKEAYVEAVEKQEGAKYRGEGVIRGAIASITGKVEAEKDGWVEKFNREKKK